ncbi:MAG: hypothetical protein K2W88_03905 [Pararheinheimera sp.]|nr:hypothetical protein [Rheinheimera sp.]
MHRPVVGDSWLKGKSRSFIAFCETWWVKNLVGPVVFLLPPMLLTSAITRPTFSAQLVQAFGQKVGDVLNSYPILLLASAFIYVALIKAIYAGISVYSKPAKDLETKDILAILHALNIVVGDKNQRFSTFLRKNLKNELLNPATTFHEITRPDQQIALLTKSLLSVFDYLDDKNTVFRVGLMRISNSAPVEWVAFEPAAHPPRTQPEQLAAPSSTISLSIRTKSIIVVEDIQNELSKKSNKKERRFLRGHTQETDQGSQLCFPITHASTGAVEYVVCIAGNKKACLIEKHAELYKWIIEHFSTRISLEHSLLVLKDKANVKEAA